MENERNLDVNDRDLVGNEGVETEGLGKAPSSHLKFSTRGWSHAGGLSGTPSDLALL
jgi:hypothetical protein